MIYGFDLWWDSGEMVIAVSGMWYQLVRRVVSPNMQLCFIPQCKVYFLSSILIGFSSSLAICFVRKSWKMKSGDLRCPYAIPQPGTIVIIIICLTELGMVHSEGAYSVT
jgi:hypothetical protein